MYKCLTDSPKGTSEVFLTGTLYVWQLATSKGTVNVQWGTKWMRKHLQEIFESIVKTSHINFLIDMGYSNRQTLNELTVTSVLLCLPEQVIWRASSNFFVIVSLDYASLSTLISFCFYSAPQKVTSVSNLFFVEIIRVMLSALNILQPKDSRGPLSFVHCFR